MGVILAGRAVRKGFLEEGRFGRCPKEEGVCGEEGWGIRGREGLAGHVQGKGAASFVRVLGWGAGQGCGPEHRRRAQQEVPLATGAALPLMVCSELFLQATPGQERLRDGGFLNNEK